MQKLPRPLQIANEYIKDIPGIGRYVSTLREGRNAKSGMSWPSWCYIPTQIMADIFFEAGKALQLTINHDVRSHLQITMSMTTWLATKGIYRLDPTLLEQLWDTPIEGAIPCEVLKKIPEWGIYVEVHPPRSFLANQLYGFYAHIDWDPETKNPLICLTLDCEQPTKGDNLLPVTLVLGENMTIPEVIDRSLLEVMKQLSQDNNVPLEALTSQVGEKGHQCDSTLFGPVISLLLYVCSVSAEYRDKRGSDRQPANPKPTKTKKSNRVFPASNPTTWEVGYRMGAALRLAEQESADPRKHEPTGKRVKAHMRRAHWHAFWTGRMSEPSLRKLEVKWLPPIPVGLSEDMIATIRSVT